MIDAAPDMPDPGAQILDECRPRRRMIKFEFTNGRGPAQRRGLSRAVRAEREQTAMRRIFFIQHSVVDGQPLERISAIRAERKPQIAAIDTIVDLDGPELHAARSRCPR